MYLGLGPQILSGPKGAIMRRPKTIRKGELREELDKMPTTPFRPYAAKLLEYHELHTAKEQKKRKLGSYWYFKEFEKRFEGNSKTIKGAFALAHVLLNAEREGYNVDPCWEAFNDRKGGPWAIIDVCRASKKAFRDDRQGTGIINDQIARLARLRPMSEPPPRAVESPEETSAAEQEALEAEIDAIIAEAEVAEVAEQPVAEQPATGPTSSESTGDDAEPDPVEPRPKPPTPPPASDISIRFEFGGNTAEFKGTEAPRHALRLLEDLRTAGASATSTAPATAPATEPPPRRPATATDEKLPSRVLSVIGHDEVSIADVVERLRAIDALPRHQSPEHLHNHMGVVLSRMARKGMLDRVGRGHYRVKFLRVVV